MKDILWVKVYVFLYRLRLYYSFIFVKIYIDFYICFVRNIGRILVGVKRDRFIFFKIVLLFCKNKEGSFYFIVFFFGRVLRM